MATIAVTTARASSIIAVTAAHLHRQQRTIDEKKQR